MGTSEQQKPALMASVSGLRGTVGGSLTPDVVVRYVGAFAGWVSETTGAARPTIVLGRDGRAGGQLIRDLVVSSLRAGGCDVMDLGVVTTPTVGLMVGELRADGGLVVTASHNPAEWNGLKPITAEGRAPSPADAGVLLERFRNGLARVVGHDRYGDERRDGTAVDRHVDRVLTALEKIGVAEKARGARFKVVVDSVNCSGARVMARLLEALNCKVTHLNKSVDGVFPHMPEPTAEHLTDLCEKVGAAKADIGLAQDPDADRLAIIDGSGRYIGEEYTLALSAMSLLGSMGGRAKGARLAANLSTSRMIDDVASEYGARVVRTAVGEANVVMGMRDYGCVLGGEGNGGVVWADVVSIRDSVGAAGLVLGLMARTGRSVRELVDAIPAYAMVKRKVVLKPGLAERAIERVNDAFPDAERDTQDGLRVDFESPSGGGSAWLHVRASNTEPILRLIVEAPTRADSDAIIEDAQHSIGG